MKTVEFGSLFEFIRNGMNVRQDKSGDGLPISRIETISDATVDGTRVGYAGLAESDCNGWLLQYGDILFSHINSVEHIGKCAVYEGNPPKLVHGMNLLCFRPDINKLTPQFGKYLIRSQEFRTRLSSFINKAVNQASVSIGNLKSIPVPLPPLPDQKRIAAVLDKAEELRAKRRAALAELDTLTQAIFLEMFGDPVTSCGKWPMKSIEDIASQDKHAIVDGPFGSSLKPDDYLESGVPVVRIANITKEGYFSRSNLLYIGKAKYESLRRSRLLPNDVLVSRVGTIGNTCIFPDGIGDALLSTTGVCKITVNTKLMLPALLHHALRMPTFQDQIHKSAST